MKYSVIHNQTSWSRQSSDAFPTPHHQRPPPCPYSPLQSPNGTKITLTQLDLQKFY